MQKRNSHLISINVAVGDKDYSNKTYKYHSYIIQIIRQVQRDENGLENPQLKILRINEARGK